MTVFTDRGVRIMKLFLAFLFAVPISGLQAQTVFQLSAIDYVFDPDTLNMTVGDIIHLTLSGTEHSCVEVSEATWLANDNTPNGGFEYGPGTLNPGTHFVFPMDSVGTFYYVCVPHAAMGMKGVIIVADISNAIAKEPAEWSMRLFPDPASDAVNVFTSPSASHGFMHVMDAQGREVLGAAVQAITTLDTSTLEEGTYLVICSNDRGVRLAHEKLMIVR